MRPGLIAGAGKLPYMLADRWESAGLKPVIIAIDGFAKPDLYQDRIGTTLSLGAAGRMIDFLKKNDVTDLVINGRVSRPDYSRIKPDLRGMRVIAKLLLKKKIGDDALLKIIRAEIEKDGFKLRALQEFLPEVLTPPGLLTKTPVLDEDKISMDVGFRAARAHGLNDQGQSIVVQDGIVIGFEGEKGTNALIRDCAARKKLGRGPLLVKTCKPQQDKSLDLPTVGLSTAREIAAAGFSGMVLQAGETLFVDRDETIEFCDQNNIFIYGISA